MKVKESLNVTFDESPPPTKVSPLVDDDVGEEEAIKNNTKVVNNNNEEDESIEVDEVVNIKYDGGVELLLRSSNKTNGRQNIFQSIQVHQGDVKRKFGLEDYKPTKTPMSTKIKLYKDDEADFVDSSKYRVDRYIRGTTHLGLWYPKGIGIETVVYADSNHAGDYVDRKSTSGVSEYVSIGKACQQELWMKQALIDYGIRLDDVPIMCDNKGVTPRQGGNARRKQQWISS
ncbi:hypothetical protein Tco_0375894 [Tanacetum coccineum]